MMGSRFQRLISEKLASQLAASTADSAKELAKLAEEETAWTIARMRQQGWRLKARLETGEGVFVQDKPVGLHIQLAAPLYRRLGRSCNARGWTKRAAVSAALERYLDTLEERGTK